MLKILPTSISSVAPVWSALSILVLSAGSPQAAVVSFQEGVSPTGTYNMGSTFIRSGNPDDNQDSDPDLEMIVGPTVGEVIRGLLEFDISTIPSGDQIDSASLVLTTHATSVGIGGTETFNVHAYNFDIDETTATWNAPGSGDGTAGGTFGTLLSSASFDVTQLGLTVNFNDSAAFQTAVGNALAGDGVLRLILANIDETVDGTHNFARFAADSFGTPGDRPELIVTHSAIPEPSSVLLVALGGLALLRRRRS